jgi:hypothetical protein
MQEVAEQRNIGIKTFMDALLTVLPIKYCHILQFGVLCATMEKQDHFELSRY